MRQRARTDLCGGRSVMVVPTATMRQLGPQVRLRETTPEEAQVRLSPDLLLCRTGRNQGIPVTSWNRRQQPFVPQVQVSGTTSGVSSPRKQL